MYIDDARMMLRRKRKEVDVRVQALIDDRVGPIIELTRSAG